MTKRPSPISATVDFDADGVQHGYLRIPHSHDESAWGSILLPIAVARSGAGPTALLTGANHGDEYEGPVALMNLASRLDTLSIQGRVIVVPMMNYPAFRAARRTSPIDGGNMNRSFPGNPRGTVTEKIADYFQRTLLPLADYVLDLHSGGKTLEFLPFAAVHALPDPAQQARCEAAMDAFGAPYAMTLLELDAAGMYDTAAETAGKVFVSTELGGGGSASPATVGIAQRGVDNFLRHAGILPGVPEAPRSRRLDMPDGRCYVICQTDGLLELLCALGDAVSAGEPIARVHALDHTGGQAVEYTAGTSGVLAGRHFPGLIRVGDVLAVVAVPRDGA